MQIEYSMAIAEIAKNQKVDILRTADEMLIQQAIAQQLEKEPSELTESDYKSIKGLNLFDRGIGDISSLANLKNITLLDLNNNKLSDISSLANLTNLTDLGLGGNQLSDISSLFGLKRLKYLDIRGCMGITDKQVQELQKALPKLMIER